MPIESTIDRVTRMLAMMGYLSVRDRVPVAELAENFSVTESQVLEDVDLLWVTGTPGYYPDDLIDFSVDDWEESLISLRDARGLGRPVPLAPREALALAAAVEWLRGVAGPDIQPVLASVARKLQAITPTDVEAPDGVDPVTRSRLVAAVEARAAVEIDYVSAEDHRTTRVIEPRGLYTDGVAWYVEGWCHLVGDERTFRLDRILAIRPADAPAARPVPDRGASGRDPVDVVLVLDRRARWLAEEIPGTSVREVGDVLEVRLTVSRTDWLVRRLLALGPAMRAVGPPEVRHALAGRARAALEAYTGT